MTEVRSGKYYISLNWAPFEESEPKRPHGSFQLPRQEHKAESDLSCLTDIEEFPGRKTRENQLSVDHGGDKTSRTWVPPTQKYFTVVTCAQCVNSTDKTEETNCSISPDKSSFSSCCTFPAQHVYVRGSGSKKIVNTNAGRDKKSQSHTSMELQCSRLVVNRAGHMMPRQMGAGYQRAVALEQFSVFCFLPVHSSFKSETKVQD